jgi:transposase
MDFKYFCAVYFVVYSYVIFRDFLISYVKIIDMFVRKKINKNGTCTVLLVAGERIVGKKNPVTRTIKYFGTAKNKRELKLLLKQAEKYKANLEAASPKARVLKIASDLDIKSCGSRNTGFADVYGPIFDSIFNTLDLKSASMQKLRDLVIMRIAAPASKHKTTKLAEEYGINHKVDSIYKFMDLLTVPMVNKIKNIVYEHTTKLITEEKRTIDVLFYDLTTIHFETSTQDEIRDFGFSKDGKHQHVQIMLAVIVTTDGLPIDYKEFSGNTYEGHTLIPVLEEIKERYNIGKIVLVADAALMNNINLRELDNCGMKYIIAARIKNTKKDIKEKMLDIATYNCISRTTDEDGHVEEIKAKIIDSDDGDFLIAYHSTRRARKDEHDREKSLEKIEKHIHNTAKSKLTGALKKAYVKISKDCKIEIDQIKLELEKQYDGFFGLRTNIKDLHPLEFLSSYRGLWQVEQTFRIAKSSLEIRPVFHYSPRRIRAHFSICYIALALVRYVEFMLKNQGVFTPYEQLHLFLDRMRVVRLVDHKNDLFEFIEDPPPQLPQIYQALKIKWPKKFSSKPNL